MARVVECALVVLPAGEADHFLPSFVFGAFSPVKGAAPLRQPPVGG
jgi:hypothetical protein